MVDDNSPNSKEIKKTSKSKPKIENPEKSKGTEAEKSNEKFQSENSVEVSTRDGIKIENNKKEENTHDSVDSNGIEVEKSSGDESNEVNEENAIDEEESSSNEDYSAYLNEIKVKKKKEHKFDEMYEKEIEKAQDEWLSMMVYCPICKTNIFAWYRKSIIEKAPSYPVYIVWVHGEPNHGLLYRVDKDFVSRGEKPVVIEYDPNLYSK